MSQSALFMDCGTEEQTLRLRTCPKRRRSLSPGYCVPYSRSMNLQDGSSVVADLTTIGHKTGERRTVELRFTTIKDAFMHRRVKWRESTGARICSRIPPSN